MLFTAYERRDVDIPSPLKEVIEETAVIGSAQHNGIIVVRIAHSHTDSLVERSHAGCDGDRICLDWCVRLKIRIDMARKCSTEAFSACVAFAVRTEGVR